MGKRISENCVVIFALFFETFMPKIYNEEILLKGATKLYFMHYLCVFIIFLGLSNSMFSTFYFGKLVSWFLVFNLFSVFHEFFIQYHYNIYICCLYKYHLVITIFHIYKNLVFTHVSKNMLPQSFWVN